MNACDLAATFGTANPRLVAQTAVAEIWRVEQADGTPAALKRWHRPEMGNEGGGIALAEAVAGQGMVQVLARGENSVLMEWLEGPPLGDLVRSGDDEAATIALAATAHRLHGVRLSRPVQLSSLRRWYRALFELRFTAEARPLTRSLMREAATLALKLLESQTTQRPLHGDLHHDNIHRTARGDIAFDAKGLLGDPAFEYANAFRNPVGAEALMRHPATIRARADIFATTCGVPRQRLLQWAATKCALSIAWRAEGRLTRDRELDLLAQLLRMARDG
ncbi:aminoglycoside phosphotransferase family protein [Algicella marina]|uniref:Phosphotransferase n=1 Tax=Algicella marina TaxID=2683284 RepID=A0A6P1T5F0_9RHOB|nr:aminoglycoside phosphotransferase family protein [Algicella marina]QHQ37011.1 phosphotransferase [Algicella marina]